MTPSDEPLGALNTSSDAERAFGVGQKELAQLFATQASGILFDAGVEVSNDCAARGETVSVGQHASDVVASTRSTERAEDRPTGG